jgi:hypothetical protein
MRKIINTGDRRLAGPTLPPKGLFLRKIEYYREPLKTPVGFPEVP